MRRDLVASQERFLVMNGALFDGHTLFPIYMLCCMGSGFKDASGTSQTEQLYSFNLNEGEVVFQIFECIKMSD